MRIFGKSFFAQKRVQNCLVLTQDRRIIELGIDVVKGYMTDHQTRMAWLLNNMRMFRHFRTGGFFYGISEIDAEPLALTLTVKDNDKMTTAKADIIAVEEFYREIGGLSKDIRQQKIAEMITIVMLMFAVVTLVLIVFVIFSSGKVNFGF